MSDQNPISRLNAALEGRYRIERKLGEGGMATVYLADDLRHERKVALKVLKPELAAVVGAERFLAEIKTTAKLQHPHILPLHDSGEADSFLFYVMPYVEGESLRERLDREHQLPVDEAVRVASDVAEALDYAHSHGVIHRDIKPANILLHAGRPLIADFGIALAVGAAGGGRLTETGLSLGTPHYMSPEQATGDLTVGPAADVYALGCVLYEMLVGEPPYTGSTAQAVLGKIVTGDADAVTKHRRSVPANVDAAIRKALEKVPADRFTNALEFARAVSDPGFRHGTSMVGDSGAADARDNSLWRRAVPWGLAAAFGVAALFLGLRPRLQPPVAVVRFTVPIPPQEGADPGARPPFERYAAREMALSPDGQTLVYRSWVGGQYQLFLRRLDQERAMRMEGVEGGAVPTFSPDGAWLAFIRAPAGSGSGVRPLERISMIDSHIETIATVPGLVPMTWGDDGTIVLSTADGLYQVPATGGVLDTIASADPGSGDFMRYGEPWMLPGSAALLVHVQRSYDPADAEIVALDLATGTQKTVLPDAMVPMYIPTGHLLFVRRATLMAVPFDIGRLEVRGQPVAVVDDVMQSLYANNVERETGAAQAAVSASGNLVYAVGGVWPEVPNTMARVTLQGDTVPVEQGRQYLFSRVSPDGTRLAMGSWHGQQSEIWVHDLRRHVTQHLNTGAFGNDPFEWTPDGRSLVFSSTLDQAVPNLYRIPVDGSAPPLRLTESDQEQRVWSVSSQGVIAFNQGDDIWTLPPDGMAEPFFTSPGTEEAWATFSPDGRWLAYTSDQTGRREAYVRPYPGPDPATLITNGGAAELAWSRDGRQLYYIQSNMLTSVDLTPGDDFTVGQPRPLMGPITGIWMPRSYDEAPDGSFFMVVNRTNLYVEGVTTELHVVLNLTDELRDRLPN